MISEIEVKAKKSGQLYTPPAPILNYIETSFQSANNFTAFDGVTSENMEARWIGFKHTTTGIVIVMSARSSEVSPLYVNGVAVGRRDDNGVWTFRQIIGF